MKANFNNVQVKSVFLGDKVARWNTNNYNNSRVTVKNLDTGVKIKFDFWGSIMEPTLETEQDLIEALYCFMSDAQSGTMEFDDFCSEFGYELDSIKVKKTWKACKKSLDKAKLLIVCDFERDAFASELNEKING